MKRKLKKIKDPRQIVLQLREIISQPRPEDGYYSATAACRVADKHFDDYLCLRETKEFLAQITTTCGIPLDVLVRNEDAGRMGGVVIWVHPLVAINLAIWCDVRLALGIGSIFSKRIEGMSSTPHSSFEALFAAAATETEDEKLAGKLWVN